MIRFACAHCQKQLSVKDEAAGKKVKCPGCQKLVAVPLAGASPATSPASVGGARTAPGGVPAEPQGPTLPAKNADQAGGEGRADVEGPAGPGADRNGGATGSNHGAEPGREPWDFLAPPEGPDEIGRLGPYRILKVIGSGGMGVVFQAEDPKLKRKVALKAMRPALAASETARKRFLREAQTAAAIEHDHIVPIFQVGEDRGVPFLTMPFLKGESLDRRLKRDKTLPVAEVLRIGREAAAGLSAAHAAGLVHRDIKLANLWLEGEEGRVKILDFGLARSAADGEELTQLGAVLGTPGYMAPEQAAGEEVDSRCDLFSLGCVLYRMCTGRLPSRGADGTPTPPAELRDDFPLALSDLVMELIAEQPEERPGSARAVAKSLQRIEDRAAPQPAARGRGAGRSGQHSEPPAAPARPKGAVIKERRTPGGRTLTWPLPGSGVADYFQYIPYISSMYLLFYLCQLYYLLWQSPRAFSLPEALARGAPLLLFLSGWRYCKPARPESITLGGDYFRHYLGQSGGPKSHLDYALYRGLDVRPWWRQLLGLPLLVEIPKDELEPVVLEGKGECLRLIYDSGVDRIEIGRHLRKREKEWLAEVIREWQEEE
jgi:serine/threonine protein kinase